MASAESVNIGRNFQYKTAGKILGGVQLDLPELETKAAEDWRSGTQG